MKDYGIVLMLDNSLDYHRVHDTNYQLTLATLVNRCLTYIDLGDYGNALQDITAASKMSPSDKTIFQTMGVCYHK